MVGSKRAVGESIRYLLLIMVLVVMIFPLLWMFRVAFMESGSSISWHAVVGSGWTLGNFMDLFASGGLGRPLFNSVLVGSVVTVGNILFCFMVAYALARYRSMTNRLLFSTVILVLMIPAHIVIVPLYLICLRAGLYDTYWALILPWLVNPIGIFLVKQYIESIPESMEEAARVDGAGEFRILFQVVMPLCKPALAVLAIQVFFTNWNSFLFPFILTSHDSLRTLPVALALYQGHQAIDWQHLMAGSAVAVLPVLVVFLLMQRQLVSGITAGAIKQ
ncbi:MAG: carbohydrate ABC transporter permease [Candidatus Zixiibacteriota bacterium]|nr:MAG: carbohydrate ABC transporter permease [candidate division Zixibacteria bacterium]